MPRISADTVAEHVAEQEAAVFNAAIGLFMERGYAQVTLADIAAEIGLARTSLYRYFPDKAHILLRWLEQEIPKEVERSTTILEGEGTPRERILAWAHDQLRYSASPEHELMSSIGALLPELDTAIRAMVVTAHVRLLDPLRSTVGKAGVPAGDRQLVAEMIQGLVVASAGRAGKLGGDGHDPILDYLDGAISGLLDAA